MALPLKVLFVEDNEWDAELMIRHLKRGGYAPVFERVDTPDQMIAALNRQEWDIVISDHSMPRFDAPSALKILQEAGQDTPFIVVSGTIGEEKAVGLMKAGAQDYIIKDNLSRLLPTIDRELREANVRRRHKRLEKRLSRLNECLLDLGADSARNIDRLVQLCCEQLEATYAVFCRFENGVLFQAGGWNATADFYSEPDVAICRDIIRNSPSAVEVRNDPDAPIDAISRNGFPQGTAVCLGRAVLSKGVPVGVLCLFYRGNPEFCNEDKEFIGIVASALGVEEDRRNAVDALHRSENDLRRITGNIRDLVLELDLTGIYRYASPSFEYVLGYKPDELIGTNAFDLIHPDDLGQVMKVFAASIRQIAPGRAEFRYRHADGHYMWMEANGNILQDQNGNLFGAVIGSRDITDRKEAEQALRESEAKYRSLVENSADVIIRFDKHKRHLFVSPSVKLIFSREPSEFLEKSHRELGFPDSLCLFWENSIDRVFETGKSCEAEIRVDQENGPAYLNARFFPESYESGEIGSVLCVARDVTREKSTEAQLLHAQKMEAVGTLAGGIAHDFNNLLQAIQGYSELLLLGKSSDQPGYRELNEISRAVEQAAALTRQLLAYGRKVESKLQPQDLNAAIRHMQSIMDRTFPKNISIEVHLDEPALWEVNADASQMNQVLLNLAVNARDAMPKGGTLRISAENVTVRDTHSKNREPAPGKYVRLTVSDTGLGMDESTMAKIFDPFFTTKEVGKGTGLGLAMVYGILQNHHGHIFCDSKAGKGTTFTVYLPALGKRASSRAEADEEQFPVFGTETILLVDDEAMVRELAEVVLLQFGYKVVSAASAERALDLYRQSPNTVDLVVLDLVMPGMGGEECLLKLREINPNVKVVISSGYGPKQTKREILSMGAEDFIDKPYRIEDLLQVVRRVLREGKG
jgi:PAS domain S-box-containing protein